MTDRDKRPSADSPEVRALIAMTDETVSAKHLAPVLKMNERTIIKYAKDGTWNQDNLGKFVISGEGPNAHVKFFRKDFLQKCGFIEKIEKKTTDELLQEVITHLLIIEKLLNEKTASCGNS